MTLTGGLWFGISKVEGEQYLIKFGMFVLACAGNLAFCVALWRIRASVMQRYLERMRAFAKLPEVDKPRLIPKFVVKNNYVVVWVVAPPS